MALCLGDQTHGYYVTRDPLGASGDFTTAPEVSQMFGELIGLWMAAMWTQMGSPENIRVVELGPGRGTLMKDALRAVKVLPAFPEAMVLHLVEISPVLRAQQQRTLADIGVPVYWHDTLADVPKGTTIVVANEFFDALPVDQAVKTDRGWHERRVGIDADGKLVFTVAPDPIPHFDIMLPPPLRAAAEGAIFEWRSERAAMDLGRRLADERGAALVIDYGHVESELGDTLQAVGRHAYADVLSSPGNIDLTAHVDFQALKRAVEAMGVTGFGPIDAVTIAARPRYRDAGGPVEGTSDAHGRRRDRSGAGAADRSRPQRHGRAVQGGCLRASGARHAAGVRGGVTHAAGPASICAKRWPLPDRIRERLAAWSSLTGSDEPGREDRPTFRFADCSCGIAACSIRHPDFGAPLRRR